MPDRIVTIPGPVGFVGLGTMGSRMAARLAKVTDLVLLDSDSEVTATVATTVGGRAASSVTDFADVRIVVLMLPDSDVVESVVFGSEQEKGLVDALPDGALVIDMSSSDPIRSISVAERLAARKIGFVDAPVSGGPVGAADGQLAIMAGGTPEDLDVAAPVLQRLGRGTTHVGGVGSGHAVKALNNLLAATHLVAASEILSAGERFGLDPSTLISVINQSSGVSGVTQNLFPTAVLTKSYDFGFALRLMAKDTRLGVTILDKTGTAGDVLRVSAELWAEALASLGRSADMSAMAQFVENRTSDHSSAGTIAGSPSNPDSSVASPRTHAP